MCLWICFELELACWGAECMGAECIDAVWACKSAVPRLLLYGHVSVLLMELCALLLAVDACMGC